MLASLALDDRQTALYRAVLRSPDRTPEELAASAGTDPAAVRELLAGLTERGLLQADGGVASGYRPVRPDVAVEGALAAEQAEIARRQEQVVAARQQVTDLLEDYLTGTARASALELELVEGLAAIRARLHSLVVGARRSVDCLSGDPEDSPEAVLASQEDDAPLHARGVAIRYCFPRSVRDTTHIWPALRAGEELGAQYRLVEEVPLRLVVVDSSAAVLPLDPAEPARGALFVWSPSLVACAAALFASTWAAGQPLRVASSPDAELAERDRELLELLAAGAQDDRIARQLGLSVRTVRRDLARLFAELGAETRFEAGVRAARRGWL